MTIGMTFDARKKMIFPIGRFFAGVSLIFVCAIAGVLAALVPAGQLVRIFVLPTGLGLLVLSWMLRRKDARLPGRGVFILLMASVCMSVLWPRYVFFSLGGPHVNPQTLSVFASLAAIVFWATYSPGFSNKLYRVIFSSSGIGFLVVLWFGWRLFASALGEFALVSVADYVRDLVYVSSFFLVGCAIATYEDGSKWILRVLVASGLVVAALGLIEAFMQKNYFVQFASGADNPAVADALKTIMFEKIRDGNYRAQSTFDHPIVFAQFIAAVIPLAAYIAFFERHWIWRLIGFLVVPIGLLAIVKSGSRAGLFSLAVALGFVGVFGWLRSITSNGLRRVIALATLPMLLIGLAVGYFVAQELVLGRSSSEAGSSIVRLKMFWDSVTALYESPLWGFGHGMALFKAGVISGHTGVATLDSLFLTIALDSGYVGFLLFVAIIFLFSIKSALTAVRLRDQEGARVGMLVASVLALFATFAGLSISNNMTLLWLLIAIALPSIKKAEMTSSQHI